MTTLKPTEFKGEWITEDGRFTVVEASFGVQVWDRDNPEEVMDHGTHNVLVDTLDDAKAWIAEA